MSAFEGTYTTPLAGSYAILLDSFDNSIQELAQLLSLTLPSESSGEARNEFVAQLVTDARKAVPNHQLQTEEDGVTPKEPAQLVEDPQAKVAVIQHLASVVETHDLSRLNQNDLTSFASLYISLLLPLQPAPVNVQSQVQKLIEHISDANGLTVIYNLLPSKDASFAGLRLAVLVKVIQASRHSQSQSLAIQHLLENPGMLTKEAAESITQTLLADDPQQALDFVSRLPTSLASEKLQRSAFRLVLANPTAFRFSPSATSLPEWKLATALFEQSALDDALLSVDGLPELSKAGLQVKQRSLALAEALAKGGDKVPYADVRQLLGGNANEDALESAVIDAIKASLLTARLNSPKQEINVTSIAPYIAVRSAFKNLQSGSSNDMEDWKLVKAKLEALRKSMDDMMAGLQTVLPAAPTSAPDAPAVEAAAPAAA